LKYTLSAAEYLDLRFDRDKFCSAFCDDEREYSILTKKPKH
jgi:hypothetical protein